MASGPDNGLRSIFQKFLPGVDWQAIEYGGINQGVPDSNGCYRGHEFWIEMKATTGWAISFRPAQIPWIFKRRKHGGQVFIAVYQTRTTRIGEEAALWLISGDHAMQLRDEGLKAFLPDAAYKPMFHCSGKPADWPWIEILAKLCSDCNVPTRIAATAA